MKSIAIISLLFCLSCVNKKETQQKTSPQKVESQNTYNLDSILNIKNDSLLLAKFIEFKNTELVKENGDLEEQKIYGGEIRYPEDSTFKVLNIFGEYSGGATYNPYSKNYLIKNRKIINSKIKGKIFRIISNKKSTEYIMFSDDYSRMGNNIQVYKTYFFKDSLKIKEVLSNKDYN